MLEDLTHALELLLSPKEAAREDGHKLIASAAPRMLNVAAALKAAVVAVLEAEHCLTYPEPMTPLEYSLSERKMLDAMARTDDARRLMQHANTDFGDCAATQLHCEEVQQDVCAPL